MEKFRFRDKDLADEIFQKLKDMNLNIRLMHVCGTHQDTLVRFGLEENLNKVGVEIRQGPGCPVCVTTPKEIEEAILLSKKGKKLVVFGDMIKVPGASGSLADARARGGDIQIAYGVDDAVNIASQVDKEVVFMAVGFETTIPSIAMAIKRVHEKKESQSSNFSILSCHRIVPPALKTLIELGEVKLHGLIEPGHVSTIIGARPYEFLSEKYNVPQVIAGFEPLDLLMGIYMLARQIEKGEAKVEIEYTRSVKYEGNPKAVSVIDEVFEPFDIKWRGFPEIPESGLRLKSEYEDYDARQLFAEDLKDIEDMEFSEPAGCKCGDVLRGVIYSDECPLFGKACTPEHPVGPCMVSAEGSCNILLKYGRRGKE
ncbi:MAG: hydrogenase formation protein HypD [Thermoplasmata archaeon]|nr:MAG: hydrogenase formation protein HypD [Thermoplasmata archaeon]